MGGYQPVFEAINSGEVLHLEAQPIICAVVSLDVARKFGESRYGKSYLARADAFALDPIRLSLSEQIFSTTTGKGLYFGWRRKV